MISQPGYGEPEDERPGHEQRCMCPAKKAERAADVGRCRGPRNRLALGVRRLAKRGKKSRHRREREKTLRCLGAKPNTALPSFAPREILVHYPR